MKLETIVSGHPNDVIMNIAGYHSLSIMYRDAIVKVAMSSCPSTHQETSSCLQYLVPYLTSTLQFQQPSPLPIQAEVRYGLSTQSNLAV